VVLIADRSERLDKFLARSLPQHSRSKLVRLVDRGGVLVEGRAEKPSFQLSPGMSVTLDEPAETEPHDLTPADIPIEVVYEDDDLMIVNKPRGLAAHPAASLHEPSLVNALLARGQELSQAGGAFRPGIVHRLDKDTTGLMVIAKNDESHVSLARQIESKSAERRYVAVVAADPPRERFIINAPLARDKRDRLKMGVDVHGKEAVTHVKKIARLDQGALLAVRLETGRTHQIRVHLRAVGLPVLGDTLYAPKEFALGPLQLHAAYLALHQPRTGAAIVAYAQPPDDFIARNLVSQHQLDPF
jgi:23S rRNA pseudouridine1911/1915/1917 synthase